jgi:hypothetical protein
VRRSIALAAAFVVFWMTLTASSPAGAIETSSFGLGPAGQQSRTSMREEARPGKQTADAVRVWNKTDQPVTVLLDVQGASIDGGGQVQLGGNGGAAPWIKLGSKRVTLAPRQGVDVPVTIDAPRKMPKGTSTAALVAEAESPGSANVAVVQRVAMMVYVSVPSGSSLSAALGWVAWAAVVLLAAVVVYTLVIAPRYIRG